MIVKNIKIIKNFMIVILRIYKNLKLIIKLDNILRTKKVINIINLYYIKKIYQIMKQIKKKYKNKLYK